MAQYVMQEAVDLNNEGKTIVYPKLIINECVDSDKLAQQIASHTTFSYGEIIAIVNHLGYYIAHNMAEGKSVKIKGLGVLTPTLAYKKGVEREEVDGEGGKRNATSLMVGSVNFRADKSFVNEVRKNCDLHRSKRKFIRRISPFTEEERLAKAKAYIEEHGMLTVADYVPMSGLSRATATRELQKWSQDISTGIYSSGRRSHVVYIKRQMDGSTD